MPRGVPTIGFPIAQDKVTLADGDASNPMQGNAILGDKYCQLFWIGGQAAANVTLMLEDGNTVLFDDAAVGVWHMAPPFRNVQSTGTGASDVTVATIY